MGRFDLYRRVLMAGAKTANGLFLGGTAIMSALGFVVPALADQPLWIGVIVLAVVFAFICLEGANQVFGKRLESAKPPAATNIVQPNNYGQANYRTIGVHTAGPLTPSAMQYALTLNQHFQAGLDRMSAPRDEYGYRTVLLDDLRAYHPGANDETLEKLVILGPGIIWGPGCKYDTCSFEPYSDPEQIVWHRPSGGVGEIVLSNITFKNCTFHDIGFRDQAGELPAALGFQVPEIGNQ